jgi:hypothetical protein
VRQSSRRPQSAGAQPQAIALGLAQRRRNGQTESVGHCGGAGLMKAARFASGPAEQRQEGGLLVERATLLPLRPARAEADGSYHEPVPAASRKRQEP